jgi:hypothetical protein
MNASGSNLTSSVQMYWLINTIDVLHDHFIGDSTFLRRKLEKINELTKHLRPLHVRHELVSHENKNKNKRETAYFYFKFSLRW